MLNISFFIFGFVTVVSQTIMLREMLVVFGGNELSVGVVLGQWLLGSTLGSFTASIFGSARKNLKEYISLSLILTGAYLIVLLPMLSNIRNFLNLLPGQSVGLSNLFIASLFSILPLSFLLGTQFSLGAGWAETQASSQFSWKIYFWESAGFMAGGLVFTFFLLKFFSPVLIIISAAYLCMIFAALLFFKKIIPAIVCVLVLIIAAYLISPFLNAAINKYVYGKLYPGFSVLEIKNTPYGQLAVLEREGTKYILSDGSIGAVFPAEDTEFTEAFSYIPLLYQSETEKALLFGGGGKYLNALSKIKKLKIDYLESDPGFMRLLSGFLGTFKENKNINIYYDDGRRFLKKNRAIYDIVYMGFSYPSTLLLNRFYSKEFLVNLKRHISSKGIAVFELPGSTVYLGDELISVNVSLIKTLNSVFKNVKILPDEKTLFLASDENLAYSPPQLAERLKGLSLKPKFLSENYIYYRVDPAKEKWFDGEIEKYNLKKLAELKNRKEVDSDWVPIAVKDSLVYLYTNAEPMSAKGLNTIYNNLWLIWVLIFIWFLSGKVGVLGTSFATGAAGMGLQIISIISLQIIAGNIYSLIGISNAVFMAGLAGGAIFNSYLKKRIWIRNIEAGFVLWVLVWFCFFYLKLVPAVLTFIFSAGTAFFVGFEFPALVSARKNYSGDKESVSAGKVYAFDLLGGFFGAFVAGVFMLPAIGIYETIFFLMILKIISFSWWAKNEG